MADVTREEFVALQQQVNDMLGKVNAIGAEFEKTRDKYTEIGNTVKDIERCEKEARDRESEHSVSIKDLEQKVRDLELIGLEEKLQQMSISMARDKEELEAKQRASVGESEARIELEKATLQASIYDVGQKIEALGQVGSPEAAEQAVR